MLSRSSIRWILAAWILFPTTASGMLERTVAGMGPLGPQDVTTRRPGEPAAPMNSIDPERGQIIWHNHLTDAIHQSTSISIASGCLAAGTYLNPPEEAELIPLWGDGTPDWVCPGTDFRVAASRFGDVIAGVDKRADGVMLYKWHSDSSTPDWTFLIRSSSVGGARALVVSPDASTIALLVTMWDPGNVRLYLFDPASSTPTAIYDAPEGTFPRNIDITADGRYIAFIAAADAYVYDRDAQSVRWSGGMGGSNDPIAISGDGTYLAYGWTSFYLREWTGSAYTPGWSISGGDFWVRSCRFSLDSGTLVVGWYDHNTHLENRIELYDLPLSSPLWTYPYTPGSGEYQDIPCEIAITADGGYAAVASWGDARNTNPEIHVFERRSSNPVLTVDTPGSMFSVDIAQTEGGGVYVAACGKHVHANEQGRGGDLYSILVTDPSAVRDRPPVAHDLVLRVQPSVCASEAEIDFMLPEASQPCVRIYSPTGRLACSLEHGWLDAGEHHWTWRGRLSPGRYWLQLHAGSRSTSRPILVTR